MTEKFIKEYDKDLYLFEQKEYCKELAFEIINKLTCSIGNDDFRTEEEVLHNILVQEQKWCNEQSKRIGGPYIDLSQIKLKFCKCWVYRYNNAKEEYKTKVVDDFLRAFHKEYFEKVFYTLPTNTLLTTEILQAIKVIAYNRNKKRVVGGLMNGKIKIWDAKTGKCLNVIQGHKSSITTITFSPDGIHIISGSSGSTLKRIENNLKIFNTETTECVRILDGHNQGIASVEYNKAGDKIVSASWDGTIKIWDASTGKCLQTLLGYKYATKLVSWTDDEKQIECISNKYEIKYIDIKKENTISNKIEIKPNNNFRYRKTLLTYGAFIEDAEFSPDGKHVIGKTDYATIGIWESETRDRIKEIKDNSYYIYSLSYSLNGKYILSCSEDKAIRIWDSYTGRCIKELKGHRERVLSAYFSPDNELIVSASDDRTIKIWNVSTGKCIDTFYLEDEDKPICAVKWHPNGEELLFIYEPSIYPEIWEYKRD